MSFTCAGCGTTNLRYGSGTYDGQICYSWAGAMICTKCRQGGIRNPPEGLKKFFDTAGVRLDYHKDGSIIVPA